MYKYILFVITNYNIILKHINYSVLFILITFKNIIMKCYCENKILAVLLLKVVST